MSEQDNEDKQCFRNINNITFDECCHKTLETIHAKLIAKKGFSLIILLERILALFGVRKAVVQSFNITTTDWGLIANAMKSIDKFALSSIKTDVFFERQEHSYRLGGRKPNYELEVFWKQLFDCIKSVEDAEELINAKDK